MTGWLLHIEAFKSVLPSLAAMTFNTALGFVMTGIGLLTLKSRTRIAQATSLMTILLSLLTMSEYIWGWNLHIDELFVPGDTKTVYPGRMAFITAVNFFLLGSALLLLSRRYSRLGQVLTLLAGSLSLLALLGYVYGVEGLYHVFWFSTVALHTAITFSLLCIGILVVYPERGYFRFFGYFSTGGYMVRRLLPVVIIIPVIVGWLRWQGELLGWYNTAFGLALYNLSNIVILGAVIMRIAAILHESDQARQNALNALQQARGELEMRVQERTRDLAQANEALEQEVVQRKQAEDLFRAMLDSAPDGSVIVDENARIVLSNKQAEKLFGYPSDEMLGKPIEMLVPATFHSHHTAHRSKYIADPHTREMGSGLDLFALRKDGSQFPVEVSLSPVTTQDGVLVFSSIRDVTERKQAESALRENEEKLQTVFNLLPVGAAVIDNDRHILQTNLALEKIMGMNSEGISTRQYDSRKYFRGDGTAITADEFPSARAIKDQVVVQDVEIGFTKENGDVVWTHVSAAPLPRNQGAVVVSVDVTERKAAEGALQKSEEQFRAMFDYAAIGISLVSPDGQWLKVNRALCELVGYSEEELFGMTFQDITHPDDLEGDMEKAQRLLAGEIQSYIMEKRYFHKRGHIVWVLLSVSLVHDNHGQPVHFVSQIQNITNRKRAEEALSLRLEEETEFQNQLKALHEITIELTSITDLDEFYRRVVELGVERLGYERLALFLYDKAEDLAYGTYGTDSQGRVIAEHQMRFNPDQMNGLLARVLHVEERFLLNEDAQLFSNQEVIGRGWNAAAVLWNGTENTGWLVADNAVEHRPIKKSLLDTLSLYAMTLGNLLVQKQIQAALAANEALLRTILENLPVGVWVIDSVGNILEGNSMAQEIWGGIRYVGIDRYGEYKGWWLASGELIQPHEWGAARAIMQGEVSLAEEIEIECFDGTHKYILYSAVPMLNHQQAITGAIIVNQDITSIKKTEIALQKTNEQLQLANEEVQRFAYIVSHDLRAPLINLKGFSSVLQTAVDTIEQVSQGVLPLLDERQKTDYLKAIQENIPTALGFIRTSVDRMDGFTSAILRLSRLGNYPLNYETINLEAMVDGILQSLASQITEQGLEIAVDSLPEIYADRTTMDQIMSNIITNAIKYLDPARAGRIRIYAEQDKEKTTLHIADNGRGIAEDDYTKIFAPFRRAGRETVEGEGMGLAYVRAIIKRYNGRIWFTSVLDIGTTFSFTIPHQTETIV